MAHDVTAKYIASLARVGQQYGLKELTVDGIKLVFSGAPASARTGKPSVEVRAEGPELTPTHAPDEIDYEALANDPRFIAFSLHGANPVSG